MTDRPGALQTAGLLCTDNRWRRVTTVLITAIEDSGPLTDSELDDLAGGFLWHDRFPWPVPTAWVRDGTVTVDHHAHPPDGPLHLERGDRGKGGDGRSSVSASPVPHSMSVACHVHVIGS